MDGDEKPLMFDPNLVNHVPAGVWRYRGGQELSVFTTSGWLDVRVSKVDVQGNGHLVEFIGSKDGPKDPFPVVLNTYNHTPLWQRGNAFACQQQQWKGRVYGHYSSGRDVLTGRNVDVMHLLFNVHDLGSSETGH